MLYPYCAFPFWYLEHSRDITRLIVYGDLIPWTTPTCFSTFYRCAMVPTLVENSCRHLLHMYYNTTIDWEACDASELLYLSSHLDCCKRDEMLLKMSFTINSKKIFLNFVRSVPTTLLLHPLRYQQIITCSSCN